MNQLPESYMKIEERVRTYNPTADFKRMHAAFRFAEKAHSEQTRKDGSPFVTHPLAVAEIVADMELDDDSIIAALLHDVIEDTAATYEDIAKQFGIVVADIVDGVTKLEKIIYTNKEEEQMENLRKMLMAMARDIRVILIKLADRLHNLRTMESMSPVKQRDKALETMEVYAPIAHRLGMQKIKWELEDISLRYLDPIGFEEISDQLGKRSNVQEELMLGVKAQIIKRLNELNIEANIFDRVKHMYSLYRKMYSQNKTLEEVFDLYAFRVIVNTVADCYNVLGVIHDLYKPIPGRFKDYIGTPKPNMYQSLHTTVMGAEGIPFEVQIRTWEMHHTAEYGIAAHWKYKQGGDGVRMGDEEKFAWIRGLLEAQQDTDAEEFVRNLKVDMFDDEVFVFTPSGDVINLPAGATPIDFAYSIHSEVGNHMTGAKVNGRIVTYDRALQNGDIVEIMTSPGAKGPSRDWSMIAKSNEAKTKIRQWFKKERRDENIQHGKAAFESELRHNSLPISSITSEEVLPQLLKKVGFSTLDDMYAAIGYGGISAVRAVNRMRDELIKASRTIKTPLDRVQEIPPNVQKKAAKGNAGIIVEGIDNCLVKFARCCTPVPGDDIVGFITRGYGVSIHRKDCKNVIASMENEEDLDRWIGVIWETPGGSDNSYYQTGVSVTARDRDGIVVDVATVLAELKVKALSLSARSADNEVATINMVLTVKNHEQLSEVVRRLNRISGVKQVKRIES